MTLSTALHGTAAAHSGSTAASRSALALECRASGGEYFRIWIANLLLTLVTFGVYSAWAKVRRLRYFYGNTVLAGSALEYHGQPMQILRGRLIAGVTLGLYSIVTNLVPFSILVLGPLLALAVPWVIVRARLFQMRMTSWRSVRFGFHGSYGGAFTAFIAWPIAALATAGLLLPLGLQRRTGFILDHTSFGTERFRFGTGPGRYYLFVLTSAGLALAALLFAALVVILSIAQVSATLGESSNPSAKDWIAVIADPSLRRGAPLLLLFAFAVRAYYRASFLNAACDGLALAEHRLHSRLQPARLFWIDLTNFLGTLFTLGLYYPFAQVRLYRYQVESMAVEVPPGSSLERLAAQQQAATSALGDEFGEAFDIDFGL